MIEGSLGCDRGMGRRRAARVPTALKVHIDRRPRRRAHPMNPPCLRCWQAPTVMRAGRDNRHLGWLTCHRLLNHLGCATLRERLTQEDLIRTYRYRAGALGVPSPTSDHRSTSPARCLRIRSAARTTSLFKPQLSAALAADVRSAPSSAASSGATRAVKRRSPRTRNKVSRASIGSAPSPDGWVNTGLGCTRIDAGATASRLSGVHGRGVRRAR